MDISNIEQEKNKKLTKIYLFFLNMFTNLPFVSLSTATTLPLFKPARAFFIAADLLKCLVTFPPTNVKYSINNNMKELLYIIN